MSTPPSDYDTSQDQNITVNKKVLEDLIQKVELLGGGDATPTEWVAAEEPVPFSDQAVYPPYVVAGHLVAWKNGSWLCACHSYPAAPFNPWWGVKDHPNELVGIQKYNPEIHDDWIIQFGDLEKPDRLARIQEVLNAGL